MVKNNKISYTFKFDKEVFDALRDIAKKECRNFNNATENTLKKALKISPYENSAKTD